MTSQVSTGIVVLSPATCEEITLATGVTCDDSEAFRLRVNEILDEAVTQFEQWYFDGVQWPLDVEWAMIRQQPEGIPVEIPTALYQRLVGVFVVIGSQTCESMGEWLNMVLSEHVNPVLEDATA